MDLTGVPVQEITVKSGVDLVLRLGAEFPKGIHLNADAPINYTFTPAGNGNGHTIEGLAAVHTVPIEVSVPASAIESGREYETTLSLAYCADSNAGLCVPVTLAWRLKVVAEPQGSDRVELTQKVKPLNL